MSRDPGHALVMARLRAHLASHAPRRLVVDGHRHAAVAVLLCDRAGVTHVTLTLRSPSLRAHSGQVSFPGGACDAGDESCVATAVRESREEIGIDAGALDIIGVLDDDLTTSRFVITPVVAELCGQPGYAPNPGEVDQIFEAPLAAFCDPARAEDQGERVVAGVVQHLRAYRWGEHRIFGATARILERVSHLAF